MNEVKKTKETVDLLLHDHFIDIDFIQFFDCSGNFSKTNQRSRLWNFYDNDREKRNW